MQGSVTTGRTQSKVFILVYLHRVVADEQVHQNLQLQLREVFDWRSVILQGKDGMRGHPTAIEAVKVQVGKEMMPHELNGMDSTNRN